MTCNEDEDDDDDESSEAWRKEHAFHLADNDESILALKENGEAAGGDTHDEDGNRQLVIHADFEDDDSEDDEDFVPGEDEELDEDADDSVADEDEVEEQDAQQESATNIRSAEDELGRDESDLNDVLDEETRTKIYKLHSAFPTSAVAVCKYVLNGSGGDVGEAYGTMLLGFQPAKPASAITERPEASLSVSKIPSKKRKATAVEAEAPDSMQVEAAETADSLLLEHYDQNGLPPGLISSGKALSLMAKAVQSAAGRRPNSGRSNSTFSNKSVRFSLREGLANEFTLTPAIDRDSLTDDSEEDSDSSSDATSSSGTSSSDEDSSSNNETKRDGQVLDAMSSSGTSSSDEDSSSSDESKEDAEISDTSSSGSDSISDVDSSSDDDSPEETSSKPTSVTTTKLVIVSTETSPPKSANRTPVPGGSGKKSTNARNNRRRQANALSRFKEKGILPAGTTLAEFNQLSEVNNDTSPEDAVAALEAARAKKKSVEISKKTSEAVERNKEFEARRQALLASLESGGVEVGPEPSKGPSKRGLKAQDPASHAKSAPAINSIEDPHNVSNGSSTVLQTHQPFSADAPSQKGPKAPTPQVSAAPSKPMTPSAEEDSKVATPSRPATETKPPTSVSDSAHSSATSSRRAKLDIGAGRRMLFGALGIKAPKSKKDEEKVRNDLMKDVRPVLTPKAADKWLEEDDEDVEDQDPEAWKEKITYRAVECCLDGIELSEPPFPFVQRWDPQQQGGWSQKGKNGGKGKKSQRDESQYYQNEGWPSKRQKRRNGKYSHAEQEEYLDASYEPSYQEDSFMESEEVAQQKRLPSDDIEVEINQQLMNDLNAETAAQFSQGPEDLAPLPEDPKTLVDLQNGQAKPGMTIAFKELTMSEETKWQPEISAYRTAVVNAILDSGEFQLTLALRDRWHEEKVYDEETGERVYGKFDMPDQDEETEEEEEADDGIRTLMFSELVEPKIVQGAPVGLDAGDSQTDGAVLRKGTSSDSQTLSHEHEDEAVDAQFSHVTETPLNSAAPESNLRDSIDESIPESPDPDARQENQDLNQNPTTPTAQHSIPEADEQTPKQAANEKLLESAAVSDDQDNSVPAVDNGNAKDMNEANAAEEQTFLGDQGTPLVDPNTYVGQISTNARLKISKIIKDAGFRSSVPSSVINDIRPTGTESPRDAKVFEKLMKDMTEIDSNPPYSPKFHGLDSSSPIKKLPPVSPSREPSSSPVRIQSSWQTINIDRASSPSLDEVDSSWQTIDPEDSSSPPVRVPTKGVATAKPAKKFKFPPIAKAQAMWDALQPKDGKTSDSSRASPGPSMGLDGTNEKDSNTSIQYPKLSVTSSFSSQFSDHGRQPDIFDDSAMANDDTPKVTASEDDNFLAQPDDSISDVNEPELPSHQSRSSKQKEPLDDLEGPPSCDDAFPTLQDVLSQRDTTRENTTPVRSKPSKLIRPEKGKKKAQEDDWELSGDDNMTPKASQKSSRPSKRRSSPVSQTRKSPRQLKLRGSQLQASQGHPSQSQPQFTSTEPSVVVDLTVSSSDVEEEAEDDVVVSEVAQQPKRFRKYALNEDDDDDFVDKDVGWVKKSSSQNPVGTRRQNNSTGLRASSQLRLNTSKRKATARF
jgi:hypothetical protein